MSKVRSSRTTKKNLKNSDDMMSDDLSISAPIVSLPAVNNTNDKEISMGQEDAMLDEIAEAVKTPGSLKNLEKVGKKNQTKAVSTPIPAPVPQIKRPAPVSRKVEALNKEGKLIEKPRSKKERLKLKQEALIEHLKSSLPTDKPLDAKQKQEQQQKKNMFSTSAFNTISDDLSKALNDVSISAQTEISNKPFKNTKAQQKAMEQDKVRFQTIIQHCNSIDSIKDIVKMRLDAGNDSFGNENKNKNKKGNKNRK